MNKQQYMKWVMEVCNQEYNGDLDELQNQIQLTEDLQIYL